MRLYYQVLKLINLHNIINYESLQNSLNDDLHTIFSCIQWFLFYILQPHLAVLYTQYSYFKYDYCMMT